MKQSEATKDRPFYSVAYEYARNPWTLYGCHHFGKDPMRSNGRTMPGTDDLNLAKITADELSKVPYIRCASVSKTEDCFNHSQVYTARNNNPTP